MKNNKIIRRNDSVKIIIPNFFVRCGYPMCPETEALRIRYTFGHEIQMLLLEIGVKEYQKSIFNHTYLDKICKEIAYAKCKTNHYGGYDRQIFTQEFPTLKDSVFHVIDTKYVKTGKYVPGSCYSSFEGGYEHEPAELVKTKTHKLLRLDCKGQHWIEAANVQKCL